MSTVLVLTGLPGSGKSEASEIAKDMSIPVLTMGNIIRTETANRGLEANSKNIGMVAMDLRAEFGDDIVLQRLWPFISEALDNQNLVLIDGMRSIAERDALVRLTGLQPKILAILASEHTRNSRLVGRQRSDDVKLQKGDDGNNLTPKKDGFSAVSERDQREKGWGVEALLKIADYEIENEGSMELFRINVKALLEGLNNPD